MSQNLHLVFGIPSPSITSVSNKEFLRWYRTHMSENLEAPLWTGGRRYALEGISGSGVPSEFPYLAAYEVGPDIAANMESLAKAGAARRNREGYDRSKSMPDWVAENRYASWNCISLEDRGDIHLPEHLFFVFSSPPSGMSFDDYAAWYREHLEENLHGPGFTRAWRFRVEPTPNNEAGPTTWSHLAIYEVDGEIRSRLAELTEARKEHGFTSPDWFATSPRASIDGFTVTPHVDTSPWKRLNASGWGEVTARQGTENQRVIKEFRENAGAVERYKFPVVLLHNKGRKSGLDRINPLACLPVGDSLAIFATSGGAPAPPDWFHNIIASPRTTVEFGTETFEVVARVTTGRERNEIWIQQKTEQPGFAHMDEQATREVPVILLERV